MGVKKLAQLGLMAAAGVAAGGCATIRVKDESGLGYEVEAVTEGQRGLLARTVELNHLPECSGTKLRKLDKAADFVDRYLSDEMLDGLADAATTTSELGRHHDRWPRTEHYAARELSHSYCPRAGIRTDDGTKVAVVINEHPTERTWGELVYGRRMFNNRQTDACERAAYDLEARMVAADGRDTLTSDTAVIMDGIKPLNLNPTTTLNSDGIWYLDATAAFLDYCYDNTHK